MKNFHEPFAALLQGAPLPPLPLAWLAPGLDGWDVAGERTWARVLTGQVATRFRPRWLPADLNRVGPPTRLSIARPANLRSGNWSGGGRLRRPTALTGT